MPLREFLQMFRGKLESSPEKAPSPTEMSSGMENDFVELVWENGQIVMQGQSNRAKKSPLLNDFQSQPPRIQDRYTGNASIPKVDKFGPLSSSINVAPPSVPSGDVYLNQEDEMAPWLHYPEDDGFKQDFCSEISPEISGVTSNNPSSHNSFLSLGNGSFNQILQHSQMVPVLNHANLEVGNATKVSARTGFSNSYFALQGQVSGPSVGSGLPNTDNNATSNRPNAFLGTSVKGQTSADHLNGMKTQKQNTRLPGTGTNLLNFSHFSRPLYKAGLEKADCLAASSSPGVEKMGNEKISASSSSTPIKSPHDKQCSNSRKENFSHSQPKLASTKVNLRESVVKPVEGSCRGEQSYAKHREDVIKPPSQTTGAGTTREVKNVEKPVEHAVAASSVGSGNSGEGASNDHINNSKRKVRDNDESESRSEENEEESVGVKKPSHSRGGSGSKRSRAAEVHNLSERRRRDRINEKMRALQELIPNCNKADKASMLDEAIDYLKTLQLQVQVMSMGAGLCMPTMMYPSGLQHMHPAHLSHYPSMATGMNMGMGYGIGMLDMNSGPPRFPIYPVPPMQGAHFPPRPIPGSSTFQGMAGANLQVLGHPSQGIPMTVPRAPLIPLMGQAPVRTGEGLNTTRPGLPVEAAGTSSTFNSEPPLQNDDSQLTRNTDTGSSINQTNKQDLDQSVSASKDDQAPNVSATAANLTATNDLVSSRAAGE